MSGKTQVAVTPGGAKMMRQAHKQNLKALKFMHRDDEALRLERQKRAARLSEALKKRDQARSMTRGRTGDV
jgi:hypothetical protein